MRAQNSRKQARRGSTKRDRRNRLRVRRKLRVEPLEDRQLLTMVLDAPPADEGDNECTLRAALMETNAHPELNRIVFRLADAVGQEDIDAVVVNSVADTPDSNPGDGVCDTGEAVAAVDPPSTMTIVPTTPLPAITDRLDLDGRRRDASAGVIPGVAIDGISAGGANGLEVNASDTKIRGLSIQRFNKSGIAVHVSDVEIVNNYIGTDLEGVRDRGNRENGVFVDNVSRVWVGASEEETRGNVISGNDANGVLIVGAEARDNFVSRNFIGVAVDGKTALRNERNGVVIARGATNNMVGPPELCAQDQDHPWPCFNVISGNGENGVLLRESGTSQNSVVGNRIGTDLKSEVAVGNARNGVLIEQGAARNTVDGNVVSGNRQAGVRIESAGSDENVVIGNWIGVDETASFAIANLGAGVSIAATDAGAPVRNRIGSDGDGCDDTLESNVISGNQGDGVWITGEGTRGNSVAGNIIGLDGSGIVVIGNRGVGVRIDGGASENVVGMDDLLEAGDGAERNTIAGNGIPGETGSAGVLISGEATRKNVVAGNLIGTNSAGGSGLGNFGDGVRIEDGATQNRVAAGAAQDPLVFPGNVISGQGTQTPDFEGVAFNGVRISGAATVENSVTGNRIGTTPDGEGSLGNLGNGVLIDGGASSNWVGAAVDAAISEVVANWIAYNGLHGVQVAGAGTENSIRGNSISSNEKLGIDLVGRDVPATRVTLNDFPDDDSGPNRLINYPVIYYASEDQQAGQWTYEAQLRTDADTAVKADFYSNAVRDESGYGEGAAWKKTVSVDPSANRGNFQFVSDEISKIAGTATAPDGSTSEFGRLLTIPVDLDADTDNTGEIEGSEQEEQDELRNPGMVIMANFDDDNNDGAPDFAQWTQIIDSNGQPVLDDDLIPIIVRPWSVPDLDLQGFTLQLTYDDDYLQLWTDQQHSQRLDQPTWNLTGQSFEGATYYLEGIMPGQTTVKLTLTSPLGTVVAEDSMIVSIVAPNLTAYRPKTEQYGAPFQRYAIPEDEEVDPGIGIRRNGDDDDGKEEEQRTPDRNQENIEGENDLVEVVWSGKSVAGVAYQLDRSTKQIRVWDGEEKSGMLLGDNTGNQVVLNGNTDDDELWVEWPGEDSGFSDLTLQVVDQRYNRVVDRASQEKLRFSPFDSLVIIIGGRKQIPSDPVREQTHGMFQMAIDLYQKDGYDVRMYQEYDDVLGNDATGAALKEVTRAVNWRGVKNIAILGYSQGGGSTYDLSSAMYQATLGSSPGIHNPYSLELTAYVDGITDNDALPFDSAFVAERRTPVMSRFHLNQYQRNRPFKGNTSGADREIDRSPLGVDHLSIDDDPAVIQEMVKEIRKRIRR